MSASASDTSSDITEASAAEPHFSLLRMSAGKRALGAFALIVPLWLAVWWAL